MQDRRADGRSFRRLTLIDEYSRKYLSTDVVRRLTREDVLERLSDLFVLRGVPAYIRSDHVRSSRPVRLQIGWNAWR